jgi:hypothetical protein
LEVDELSKGISKLLNLTYLNLSNLLYKLNIFLEKILYILGIKKENESNNGTGAEIDIDPILGLSISNLQKLTNL